ncbi:MAG: DUF5320 domain-containing protein [Desulfobacterales bacterium]|jgi:hypothetical protein
MPGFDGTGPMGRGSMTGGGFGRCGGGYRGRGYGAGYGPFGGRGCGRGRRFRWNWDAGAGVYGATRADRTGELQEYARELEDELAVVRRRMAELAETRTGGDES